MISLFRGESSRSRVVSSTGFSKLLQLLFLQTIVVQFPNAMVETIADSQSSRGGIAADAYRQLHFVHYSYFRRRVAIAGAGLHSRR
jgi:hypothetical protein